MTEIWIFFKCCTMDSHDLLADIPIHSTSFIKRAEFFDSLKSNLATAFPCWWRLLFLTPTLSILLGMSVLELLERLFVTFLLLRNKPPLSWSLYTSWSTMRFGSLPILITHICLLIHKWFLATFCITHIIRIMVKVCNIWLIKMLMHIDLRPAYAGKIGVIYPTRFWNHIRPLHLFCHIVWNFEINLIRTTQVLQELLLVFQVVHMLLIMSKHVPVIKICSWCNLRIMILVCDCSTRLRWCSILIPVLESFNMLTVHFVSSSRSFHWSILFWQNTIIPTKFIVKLFQSCDLVPLQ